MLKKPVAVFISGFGSNLSVFLERKELFESLYVVSSNPRAYGLIRAKRYLVPFAVLDPKIDWDQLDADLRQNNIDTIFCAGFMKVIPVSFIERWLGKIFNLHPSLLPKYKGLKAIDRAFEAQDDIGVTIHHIAAEVDSGKIVLQKVAIKKEDLPGLTLEEATRRVQSLEHQLVAQWIDLLSPIKSD